MTSSGSSGVATSISFTSSPRRVSRTAPPTKRALPAPSAAISLARSLRSSHAAAGRNSAMPVDPFRQVGDDRRGYPPDAMLLPHDLDVAPFLALPTRCLVDMVPTVEHEVDRGLEPGGHFGRARREFEIGRHHGQNGCDRVAGAGAIEIAGADHGHVTRVNAKLLVCLTQGGFDRSFAGIDLAAGKCDLAGVRAHVRWAVDQQEAGPLALGYRREHRGRAQ